MGGPAAIRIEPLQTARLDLEPLSADHAAEAAAAFSDERLHVYTGGVPADEAELRKRYRRQSGGRSPDGREIWLNWIVRDRRGGRLVGSVQATVAVDTEHEVVADLAWVVATAAQGQGYAKEGAAVMADWLRAHGVARLAAHVHPGHEASMAVARSLGLQPTATGVDGEVRWTGA